MAHVLIVEDEPDVLLLLENRMRGAGHEVESVTDGEQALEAVAAREPAVIILDWMMPKLDGIAVLERLRTTDTERRMKVLMLTAKSQQHDIDRAYAAGWRQGYIQCEGRDAAASDGGLILGQENEY